MPKIERDGVKIYYEVHGDGPAMILTHGYSSTFEMWHGQIEALSKRHKLILWDMRGHGRSDYPQNLDAYSEELTVGDIAALLDEVGVECAIVGGLSLGGYMSLAFWRAHPERVRALLIIGTGPGFKKAEAREAWNRRALDTAERLERDGLAALKLGSRERAGVTYRDAKGLALAARGMLTQRDARVIELLPEITVPSRGRRRGHAVPCGRRLHGGENTECEEDSDPERRTCGQYRPAAGLSRCATAVSREPAGGRVRRCHKRGNFQLKQMDDR